MRNKRIPALCALTSGLAFASGSNVYGQESSAAQTSGGLEEIIVTAQRREENLQKVPISVTAFNATALQNAGVGSTAELLNVAPGLVFNRQIKGGIPFIRGVGTPDSTVYNEPSVATYVDGVYIMDGTATILSLNNISSVEVLKGPQGTLFGRNATGGLIHARTRDPRREFGLEGNLGYGNYDTTEGALYVTGGKGSFAMDLSGYFIDQGEGFGRQLDLGGDVNRRRDKALRSKMVWEASEADRFTVTLDWNRNESDMGMARNVLPGARLFGGATIRGDLYDSTGNLNPRVPDSDIWGASVKYQHTFENSTLSILSAYRSNTLSFEYDQDLTVARLADILAQTKSHTLQSEILLVGSSGAVSWTGGLFVFSGDTAFEPLAVRATSAAQNTDLFSKSRLDSYAAFAEGTYAITPATRVTAGLRYTVDDRSMNGRRLAAPGNALPAGTLLQQRTDDKEFKEPTWRLSVDHSFNDDVLAYISYSRGFKSGVFNTTDLTSEWVDPETLDAYEVGLKSELLAGTLRVNVAAFHYDYKDIQLIRVLGGFNQLFNAATGEVNGAELEIAWAAPVPVGRLQLNAGVSYLADAEYTKFPNGPLTSPRPAPAGGNTTTTADLSGNRMIRSPEWTVNLSADYSIPLTAGELGLNVSYYYNDGFPWDSDNRLEQPSYDIVNAQASYAFGEDERYRVRLWGKNLIDKKYYSYVTANALGDLAGPGAPRTYGLSIDFRY